MRFHIWIAATLLASALFARDRSFSEWQPANAAGIAYRWNTDDLSPSACVVQLSGVAQSEIRSVSIYYRSHAGFRLGIKGPRLMQNRGSGLERTLLGCTRIEKVEVLANPGITTIIAGRVLDEPGSAVGENHAQ